MTREAEIVRLHAEVTGVLRRTWQKVLHIGELLAQQKARLPHGEFTEWVQEHLPFTPRTARNYMRVWRERALLKAENVSGLSEGYRLLASDTEPADLRTQLHQLLAQWGAEIDSHGTGLSRLAEIASQAGELQNRVAERNLRVHRRMVQLAAEMGYASVVEALRGEHGRI